MSLIKDIKKYNFREKLFRVLQSDDSTVIGKIYDIVMIVCIVLSLLPLCFKEEYEFFDQMDNVTVTIFIIDYILRWITADYCLKEKGFKAFLKYPITPLAICDLLSILPSLTIINDAFKLLRITRFLRLFRVFRAVRLIRYSKNMKIIIAVLKKSKDKLLLITFFAIVYILISALVVFNVEPQTFNSFFDAIYWATVSLTTVGYGDLYPVTTIGRFFAMCSSFVGIAIIALPASILTSDYISIVNEGVKENKSQRTKKKRVHK